MHRDRAAGRTRRRSETDDDGSRGKCGRQSGIRPRPTMPFVPDFLLRDMIGWLSALAVLAALAALLPAELGKKAD